MLKIKDNVDLKELEKYGFKTKYNEDTGEILYMYYLGNYKTFGGDQSFIKIFRDKVCFFKRLINSNKEKDYQKDMIKIGVYASKCNSPFNEIADKLYDLIKADLVEKVGNKE